MSNAENPEWWEDARHAEALAEQHVTRLRALLDGPLLIEGVSFQHHDDWEATP